MSNEVTQLSTLLTEWNAANLRCADALAALIQTARSVATENGDTSVKQGHVLASWFKNEDEIFASIEARRVLRDKIDQLFDEGDW